MYYDLIASLPHLPRFEKADRLPITPLRLEQRLRRLEPEHAAQLRLARPLLDWRVERRFLQSDPSLAAAHRELMATKPDAILRDYAGFRMTQRILLAALRARRDGLAPQGAPAAWGVGPEVPRVTDRWDAPYFGLEHVHPWLVQAAEHVSDRDASRLEWLFTDLNWRWLTARAEQATFGFAAVAAFVLKWDMLRVWLESDPDRARGRFTEMVEKVTHVQDA